MNTTFEDQEVTDNISAKAKDENLDFQKAGHNFSSSVNPPTRPRWWSISAIWGTELLRGGFQISMVDSGGPDRKDRLRIRFPYHGLLCTVRNIAFTNAET